MYNEPEEPRDCHRHLLSQMLTWKWPLVVARTRPEAGEGRDGHRPVAHGADPRSGRGLHMARFCRVLGVMIGINIYHAAQHTGHGEKGTRITGLLCTQHTARVRVEKERRCLVGALRPAAMAARPGGPYSCMHTTISGLPGVRHRPGSTHRLYPPALRSVSVR